jgi:hypothetical protein
MSAFWPFLVFVGCLAGVMGFFTWLAMHVRRRGVAGTAIGAAMASYDEAFRVTAYESHYEIKAQAERQSPMASPDDLWRPNRGEAARRLGADGGRPLRQQPGRVRRNLRRRVVRLWRGR